MQRDVQIKELTALTLAELLEVAVADAAPDETMPPMPGHPDWSPERRARFMEFFTPMLAGLDGPLGVVAFAITVDGAIAGFTRLARTERPGVAVTGIWLGRSWRGQGVSARALHVVVEQAAALGFSVVEAHTTLENVAALGTLRSLGATLKVHAEIPAYAPGLDK